MAQITFNIPNDTIAELSDGFFYKHPAPVDEDGIPECTDLQQFKRVLIAYAMREYREGKTMKRMAQPIEFQDNLIE